MDKEDKVGEVLNFGILKAIRVAGKAAVKKPNRSKSRIRRVSAVVSRRASRAVKNVRKVGIIKSAKNAGRIGITRAAGAVQTAKKKVGGMRTRTKVAGGLAVAGGAGYAYKKKRR